MNDIIELSKVMGVSSGVLITLFAGISPLVVLCHIRLMQSIDEIEPRKKRCADDFDFKSRDHNDWFNRPGVGAAASDLLKGNRD